MPKLLQGTQGKAGCWDALQELCCSVVAWEHSMVEMQSPQKVIAVQSLSMRKCGCVGRLLGLSQVKEVNDASVQGGVVFSPFFGEFCLCE